MLCVVNYLYADKPVVQFISVFFVLQRPGDPWLSALPEESSGGWGMCVGFPLWLCPTSFHMERQCGWRMQCGQLSSGLRWQRQGCELGALLSVREGLALHDHST